MYYSKLTLKRWVFRAVLKKLIIAVAVILLGKAFQVSAADTVNDHTPHEF